MAWTWTEDGQTKTLKLVEGTSQNFSLNVSSIDDNTPVQVTWDLSDVPQGLCVVDSSDSRKIHFFVPEKMTKKLLGLKYRINDDPPFEDNIVCQIVSQSQAKVISADNSVLEKSDAAVKDTPSTTFLPSHESPDQGKAEPLQAHVPNVTDKELQKSPNENASKPASEHGRNFSPAINETITPRTDPNPLFSFMRKISGSGTGLFLSGAIVSLLVILVYWAGEKSPRQPAQVPNTQVIASPPVKTEKPTENAQSPQPAPGKTYTGTTDLKNETATESKEVIPLNPIPEPAREKDVNQPDSHGRTRLMSAAASGDEFTLTQLLNKGADVSLKDADGKQALHFACKSGHARIVDTLLKHGAEIDSRQGPVGLTGLMIASHNGHDQVVRLLLQKGANPNLRDLQKKKTALFDASLRGDVKVVNQLLRGRADPNLVEGEKGRTALMAAARGGFMEIARMLIDTGANVDARASEGGHTALIIASGEGKFEVVRLLLDRGAQIEIADNNGKRAVDWARRKNQTQIVQLLQSRGAR